jgi:hypothetical protein
MVAQLLLYADNLVVDCLMDDIVAEDRDLMLDKLKKDFKI